MQYKPKRKYTEAFKYEAVRQSLETYGTQRDLAAKLGIHEGLLQRWRSQYLSESAKRGDQLKKIRSPEKSYKDLERENRRLKKQLQQAQTEAEILKKAQEYFAERRRKDTSS